MNINDINNTYNIYYIYYKKNYIFIFNIYNKLNIKTIQNYEFNVNKKTN